ncbi:hypothetical protein ACFLZW_04770 [Chloroflexota bacterium]
MPAENVFPQWPIVLIVILLGLVLWILLRYYEKRDYSIQKERRDNLLVLLLTLVAFALGIFAAILLLRITP